MLVQKELKNAYIGEYEFATKYQEVEWIWTNSNAWIDTWIAWTSNVWAWTEMLHTWTRNNVQWFYSTTDWTTQRWGLTTYPSWNWCPQRQTRHQTNVTYNTNQFYDIKFNWENNKKTLINWTNIYSLGSWTISSTYTIKIVQEDYSWYDAKVKFFKITNWTTLVADLLPCYRKSDLVIGMYDLVRRTFYTNYLSWTFTKWPDV